MTTKDSYLPQSLTTVLVESYDKIKSGLIPCIPAHYNVYYCLEEWIHACKISNPITSEVVILDDVSFFIII